MLQIKMGSLVCFVAFFCSPVLAQLQPAVADSFLRFVQNNKNKASIFIAVNDTTIGLLNETYMISFTHQGA